VDVTVGPEFYALLLAFVTASTRFVSLDLSSVPVLRARVLPMYLERYLGSTGEVGRVASPWAFRGDRVGTRKRGMKLTPTSCSLRFIRSASSPLRQRGRPFSSRLRGDRSRLTAALVSGV